ncbi:hypothetical protein H0H93_006501 [Arthromyces matolae]|nr:hypothetical protein H0H93_006501 [Arthromyces matolae]
MLTPTYPQHQNSTSESHKFFASGNAYQTPSSVFVIEVPHGYLVEPIWQHPEKTSVQSMDKEDGFFTVSSPAAFNLNRQKSPSGMLSNDLTRMNLGRRFPSLCQSKLATGTRYTNVPGGSKARETKSEEIGKKQTAKMERQFETQITKGKSNQSEDRENPMKDAMGAKRKRDEDEIASYNHRQARDIDTTVPLRPFKDHSRQRTSSILTTTDDIIHLGKRKRQRKSLGSPTFNSPPLSTISVRPKTGLPSTTEVIGWANTINSVEYLISRGKGDYKDQERLERTLLKVEDVVFTRKLLRESTLVGAIGKLLESGCRGHLKKRLQRILDSWTTAQLL